MVPDVPGSIPVLVAESDPIIRRMLQMVLEVEGYSVSTVRDGRTALVALRASSERRVVLVNHQLPDLDGATFLQAAYTDPHLAGHGYVLMSTCPQCIPGSAHVPRDSAVLAKPFTVDELLAAVERSADAMRASAPMLRVCARPERPEQGAPVMPSERSERESPVPPLLLTFSSRSAITPRRGCIVVRTRPGAEVLLEVEDGDERLANTQGVPWVLLADERGHVTWRWARRAGPHGAVYARVKATWQGQSAMLAKEFRVLEAASRKK